MDFFADKSSAPWFANQGSPQAAALCQFLAGAALLRANSQARVAVGRFQKSLAKFFHNWITL